MTESFPEILSDVGSLRTRLTQWRRAGETIALVPTMGALHEGHLALVRAAQGAARRILLSIFVNPTQFAAGEDFSAYPRPLEADAAQFAEAGGNLIFAPDVAQIYPPDFATRVTLEGPAAAGLEDRFRPTHFSGVATVVAKLINLARADIAVFGEKDYQQLKVVTRMARDLDFETNIVAVPTVREEDGLALSSRNVYLSPAERAKAPRLYAALRQCAFEIESGIGLKPALAAAWRSLTEAGFLIDYCEARHAESLAPIQSIEEGPIRLLAAAKLGRTRLIDNLAVRAG